MKKTFLSRAAMLLLTAFISSTVWAAQPNSNLEDCFGKDGHIHIRGWIYDPDNPTFPVSILVYIYTDAGCTSEYVYHFIRANVSRPDVNSEYGITGDHGFLTAIPINDAGNYWVKIFALDSQIGNTTQVTVNYSQVATLSDNMDYTAQDGKVLIGTTSGTVRIPAGASITLKNVTITGGIVCKGSATITLGGTNSVTTPFDKAGIQAGGPGTTLTIRGSGSLTATAGSKGAGIGVGWGSGDIHCGNIIIEGGNITAIGGDESAGIGSSYGLLGLEEGSCGDITIRGGTVIATGGEKAAGIGSGNDRSTCGDITISGGSVTATGGEHSTGIGCGSDATCGNITISGGTVTATGGEHSTGIGCGSYATCGNITISGGTITANGGDYGAGIGTGACGTCGDITISGGTVTANGGNKAAGIGSGWSASCGNITITNDVIKVTATKGNSDAPNSIGAGQWGSCGTVTIGGILTGNISESPYTYEPVGVIDLADGTAYPYVGDCSVNTATYTKTITGDRVGKHQAWMVPFDYTITSADLEKFTFYKINMIANSPSPEVEATNEMWVFLTKLNSGTVLHANMPYVYKPLEAVTEYAFTSSNVTVKAMNYDVIAETRTMEDIYSFYATYDNTTATEADPFYYVSINGGISLGTSATVGPYRWIIRKTSKYGGTPSYAREMHFYDGEDSSSSGIETMNWSESGSSKSAAVYTLDGRRVATDFDKQKSLQPGVYIVGGRKVVIK